MTGFGEYMVAQGLIPGGVDAMLPKPATEADVQRAVAKALSAAKMRSAGEVGGGTSGSKPLIVPKPDGAPASAKRRYTSSSSALPDLLHIGQGTGASLLMLVGPSARPACYPDTG
jgi:hypothetical protein